MYEQSARKGHTPPGRNMMRLLLLLLTVALTAAQCPNNRECDCQNGPVLYCRRKGLTVMPAFSATTFVFTEVTLASNEIRVIPADAFKTTAEVGLRTARLDISDNPIVSIDVNAFAGIANDLEVLILHVDAMNSFPKAALESLTGLKELYLKGFGLSGSLPSNALSPFTALDILSLEDCGISSMTSSDLSSQQNTLTEFHLKSNDFTAVPKEALSSMDMVQRLDLSENQIEQLTSEEFVNMDSLEDLDLSSNGIKTMNGNAFEGVHDTLTILSLRNNGDELIHSDLDAVNRLSNLRSLDVSYNGLQQLTSGLFQSMSQLERLMLNNNAISGITSSSFNGLGRSLTRLSMASNSINSIGSQTFQSLSGLESLTLDNNNLAQTYSSNTFSGLQNTLTSLHLENTGFRDSDFDSIASLKQLRTVNLQENSIVNVPDFTFENLNYVTTLDLSVNSIQTMTQKSVHGMENSLETLKLDDNQIESLSSCLTYQFTALDTIDLDGNPLRCDCSAYWLRLTIDNLSTIEQQANQWQCASPDQYAGTLLKTIDKEDLCADPPTEECESFETTPPAFSTTTTALNTAPPQVSMQLEVTNIESDSMRVEWQVLENEDLVDRFSLECIETESGNPHDSASLGSSARHHVFEDLESSTTYTICVSAYIGDYAQRTCTEETTMPGTAPSKSKLTPLQVILGAVFGVVVFLVLLGIIIACVVVYWRKKNRHPSPLMGKSTTSLNHTDIPTVGGTAKRFSKPKPYSVDMSLYSNDELERKLEGFSPEERDRILQLFSRNGASTTTLLSTTSGPRYVPDPNRPRSYGGGARAAYSNQIPFQDEGPYEELPGDQYNYIPFDEINPDFGQALPEVYPPPLRPESSL